MVSKVCAVALNRIQYLSLVLIGDCGNLFRDGEDHVEVLRVQQLGLAIFEPLSAGKGLAFWQWRSPHEL